MATLSRFGRKIALPSTRQIRHELLVLLQEEARIKDAKEAAVEPVDNPIAPERLGEKPGAELP